MQKKIYIFITGVFILTGNILCAQQLMSIEDAIGQALKNNYSIQLASTQAEISSANKTYGNAGFLPQLSLNATQLLSDNDTKQNLSSGLVVDKKNAKSNN